MLENYAPVTLGNKLHLPKKNTACANLPVEFFEYLEYIS